MDNLKKKKLDGKRIALGQKHERQYLKKIAKEMLGKLEVDVEVSKKKPAKCSMVMLFNKKGITYVQRTDKLIRICKALLRVLK